MTSNWGKSLYPNVGGTNALQVMEERLLHPAKAIPPIVVTLAGSVMDPKLVQFINASSLIAVKPLPRSIVERFEDPRNAPLSMDKTLFGIEIDVRVLMNANASSPIVVTPSGIIVVEHPWTSRFVAVRIIALQLLRESYIGLLSFTIIEDNEEQLINAAYPMDATLSEIKTEVRFAQAANASAATEVTPPPMVTDFISNAWFSIQGR